MPTNHLSASEEVPFRNLRLVYDARMPLIGVYPLSDFEGTLEFIFLNVTSHSFVVNAQLNGAIATDYQSKKVRFNQTIDCPAGIDTMLFLDHETNPMKEKDVKVIGIPLHVGDGKISVEGGFSFKGNSTVDTAMGRIETYELWKRMRVVSGPVSKFNLTISLHYDRLSRIMVYADLEAQSGSYTYSYFMRLKQTNARLGNTSKCLISTAVYGTPLDMIAQNLRSFRDNVVLRTRTGSTFMHSFNTMYYAFSPVIAEAQRSNELLRLTVAIVLLPMLTTLVGAEYAYYLLPFGSEIRMLALGLFSSTVIGSLYLSPVIAIFSVDGKMRLVLANFQRKTFLVRLRRRMWTIGRELQSRNTRRS